MSVAPAQSRVRLSLLMLALFLVSPSAAAATGHAPSLAGIPVEFILFAFTLLGVALFHHHTLKVAVTGLTVITIYKLIFASFEGGEPGIPGLIHHLGGEWVTVVNLFCLLMGFALLARHFEKSHLPAVLPRVLPHDWRGGFLLLVMIFIISSFLDNIAAAMIGGAMAHTLFRARVHVGYLAAIVAASNAGGAGSVVGDTTTTMIWISGVSPVEVLHAYVGAVVTLFVVGILAARQQQRFSPILEHGHTHVNINWSRIGTVAFILLSAVTANVASNVFSPGLGSQLPVLGLTVAVSTLASATWLRPDWEVLPETVKGTIFLLSLVLCASMMPVEELPHASWMTAGGLGFVSAVFDNIPLTELAIKQGGYDWGFLAYAVGFGGSMIWFGSSAGVALSNMYPEAKSVKNWLRHGWYVILGYVVGFLALLLLAGWHPIGG